MNRRIQNMILAALMLALSWLMPFLALLNPAIAQVISPMHIPIFLCGFLCDLPWAALVLIGGIFGRLCYHTDAKYAFAPFGGAWNSGICFFGRHAAVIYIAHMVAIPVFLALCAAISMLFT